MDAMPLLVIPPPIALPAAVIRLVVIKLLDIVLVAVV